MRQEVNQLLDWMPNPALAERPTISAKEHCDSMRHFAVGVVLITGRNGEAKAGLTATAVCSVTADPPRLVVFVNKNVVARQIIMDSGALYVNVLAGDQEEIAKVFAGMVKDVHGDARFQYGTWGEQVTGAPSLENALTSFDCRVIKVFDESTHNAFLCEVLSTCARDQGDALVYLNGSFRRIPQ